jgi:hypothetical protein
MPNSKFIRTFFLLVFLINSHLFSTPLLLIKIPTREREEKFFAALDQYYHLLSNQVPYHFLISCDLDDPVMNSEKVIEKLNHYPHLSYYFSHNSSKIEACNKDIEKHLDFDVILLGSDDMVPVVKNFDLIIMNSMKFFFPEYDGVLHFNDGFHGSFLDTLPILGKNFYAKFGYVYYPGYKSFYSDVEMTDVARLMNKIVYINKVIIEHKHPSNGKAINDSLYDKNSQYFMEDWLLYLTRQSQLFDLDLSTSSLDH